MKTNPKLDKLKIDLDFLQFVTQNDAYLSIIIRNMTVSMALSSNRTTIQNKEQGSHCFTM